MCPNHVEHVADRYLVRSIRLTERMRIWAQLADLRDPKVPIAQTGVHMDALPDECDCGQIQMKSSSTEPDEDASLNEFSVSRICRPATPPLTVVTPYDLSYGPDDEASILTDLMRRIRRGNAELCSLVTSANATQESAIGDTSITTSDAARCSWRLVSSHTCQILHDQKRQLKILVRGFRHLPLLIIARVESLK